MDLTLGDLILSFSALLDLVQASHPKQWPPVNFMGHASVPPDSAEMPTGDSDSNGFLFLVEPGVWALTQ